MDLTNMLESITSSQDTTVTEAIAESINVSEKVEATQAEYITFLEDLIEAELGHKVEALREAAIEYTLAINEEVAAPVAPVTKSATVQTKVPTGIPQSTPQSEPEVKAPLKESQAEELARLI